MTNNSKKYVIDNLNANPNKDIEKNYESGTSMINCINDAFNNIEFIAKNEETNDEDLFKDCNGKDLKDGLLFDYNIVIKDSEIKKTKNDDYQNIKAKLTRFQSFDKLKRFKLISNEKGEFLEHSIITYYQDSCFSKAIDCKKCLIVLVGHGICFSIDSRGKETEELPFLLRTSLSMQMENLNYPLKEMVYCQNVLIIKDDKLNDVFVSDYKSCSILFVPFDNKFLFMSNIAKFAYDMKYDTIVFDSIGKKWHGAIAPNLNVAPKVFINSDYLN